MAHIQEDRVKETSTTTGTGAITLAGAATGYRAFSAVCAASDTCYYCIAHQSASEWEVGLGTYNTTLARTTVLASSNAGSLVNFSAGTKDVFITMPSQRTGFLPVQTSDAPAPGSGIIIYSKSSAGRTLPKFIGPSGVDSFIQPSLFGNNVTMWLPGTGTTQSISFGVSWTTSTTQAHPTLASTNFMTQMKRATYTTTTTSGNASGVRSTAAVAWRGNAAGLGGFYFMARFGILTYVSTMQVWCGLSAVSGALGGDPSAQNDTVAMSKDTGETTWQVMTRDTSAASKTSTGRTTAAGGSSNVFDFIAFCKPNDSKITVRVVDITDGTVLVDNVEKSSNLPTAATFLYAHCECRTNAASSVAIFLNRLYIESDS